MNEFSTRRIRWPTGRLFNAETLAAAFCALIGKPLICDHPNAEVKTFYFEQLMGPIGKKIATAYIVVTGSAAGETTLDIMPFGKWADVAAELAEAYALEDCKERVTEKRAARRAQL